MVSGPGSGSQSGRDASSSPAYRWAGSLSFEDGGPRMLFSSISSCLCRRVLAGTILPGTRYLIFHAVVLLVLLSALADPDQYHSSSSELGGDFEFRDDANMCIAITISVLMVLIWAAAVHGAYKRHALYGAYKQPGSSHSSVTRSLVLP